MTNSPFGVDLPQSRVVATRFYVSPRRRLDVSCWPKADVGEVVFYVSCEEGSLPGTGEVGVLGAISRLNFSSGSGIISRERRPLNMV